MPPGRRRRRRWRARRLESERREIEELTASELERLGENAAGRMRELLPKAYSGPLVVGLSLSLGIFGGG